MTGKLNKRRKQIEVAVKAPVLFGSSETFQIGEVPINDFTYLQGFNLAIALEKQKKLVFAQGEVKDVVLPLKPKFVKAADSEATAEFNHLVVPPVGVGGITYDLSSADVSSPASILTLTDSIVTDELIAVYNLLNTSLEKADSLEFNVTNDKTNSDPATYAQFVGSGLTGAFPSGLGIPRLAGVEDTFIKLPDHKSFQDLTYKKTGFTIDFWVHMPDLVGTWDPNNFHRLVLGCENFGGTASAVDATGVGFDDGSDNVRGS